MENSRASRKSVSPIFLKPSAPIGNSCFAAIAAYCTVEGNFDTFVSIGGSLPLIIVDAANAIPKIIAPANIITKMGRLIRVMSTPRIGCPSL